MSYQSSRLVLGRSPQDESVAELAAALAAEWPRYRPLLETTARTDPEEKLRTDAATILAGFDSVS